MAVKRLLLQQATKKGGAAGGPPPGMKQMIPSGTSADLATGAVKYTLLTGATWRAVEYVQPVSTPGKLKSLRVKLTTIPGVGKSYTFTLRLNGGDSALAVTISDSNTEGSNIVNDVVVAAGDRVSLSCTPAGTPNVAKARWTLIFEGDNTKESIILGGYTMFDTASIEYAGIAGGAGEPQEFKVLQVIPTSGKIKNLYVHLSDAPGAGTNYRYTMRKNGVDTTLTCMISDVATTCNDTVNEVPVAAGDLVSLKCEPTGSPVLTHATWGMTFVADTNGESLILNGSFDQPINTDVEYNYLNSLISSWTAAEADRYQLGQECVLKNLYVHLYVAPGADKSWTFTLRQNVGDTLLACMILGAAFDCHDTDDEIAIADFDYLDLKCEPTNTPALTYVGWGLVCYIAP